MKLTIIEFCEVLIAGPDDGIVFIVSV